MKTNTIARNGASVNRLAEITTGTDAWAQDFTAVLKRQAASAKATPARDCITKVAMLTPEAADHLDRKAKLVADTFGLKLDRARSVYLLTLAEMDIKKASGETAELERHFRFEGDYDHDFNTLLVKPGPHPKAPAKGAVLYLADTPGSVTASQFKMSDFKESQIKRVSLEDACRWYAHRQPSSMNSTGDVAILCEMAADALDPM